MATLAELQSRLDTLRKRRASGVLSTEHEGVKTVYKSDADMAKAEAALISQIAAIEGSSGFRPMSSLATFRRGDLPEGRMSRYTR